MWSFPPAAASAPLPSVHVALRGARHFDEDRPAPVQTGLLLLAIHPFHTACFAEDETAGIWGSSILRHPIDRSNAIVLFYLLYCLNCLCC